MRTDDGHGEDEKRRRRRRRREEEEEEEEEETDDAVRRPKTLPPGLRLELLVGALVPQLVDMLRLRQHDDRYPSLIVPHLAEEVV